jgi:2-dehydro-3-deoxygalactonokinase
MAGGWRLCEMSRSLISEAGDTALIGIDWGTTQMRAYRISSDGTALERRESNLGIAAVRDRDFDSALRSLIDGWQPDAPDRKPIILCGMIGSKQGWWEVPYCHCPVRVQDLARALNAFETTAGPAWIVGGISATDERGHRDVMRGEETQIFGAVPPTGRQIVVAPGTHSKWTMVQDGVIENFRTYMTGEIYAVLRQHSILGRLMQDGEADNHDELAFRDGVRQVLRDPDLLHSLFSVRTRGLFEPNSQSGLASYLSGILIGSEVSGAARHFPGNSVIVIASQTLGRLYGLALAIAGFSDIRYVDGNEASLKGLWRLWRLNIEKARE